MDMVVALKHSNAHEEFVEAIGPTASARDAFAAILNFLNVGDPVDAKEIVYERLRSVVFHLLSGREGGTQLNEWAETINRVRGLISLKDSSFSERFVSLGDLLEQADNFKSIHSFEQIKKRKHVVELLKSAGQSADGVDRKLLAKQLGLGDANLSRILSNLVSAGIVEREPCGREIRVKLTDAGRRGCRDILTPGADKKDRANPFEHDESLELLRSSWPAEYVGLAVSDESKGIIACDETFRLVLGRHDAVGTTMTAIRQWLADATAMSDEVVPEEVTIADGRTFNVREFAGKGGRSIWVSTDVTNYKRKLDAYSNREAKLRRELELYASRDGASHGVYPPPHQSADILHAVNTMKRDLLMPLTSVCSAAYFLNGKMQERDAPLEEMEAVASILQQSEIVRRLARALIYLGNAQNHGSVLPEHFKPAESVQGVLERFTHTIRHTEVALKPYRISKTQIEGDRLGFEAALTGVLANFVDLASAGSTVDIASSINSKAFELDISTPAAESDEWNDASFRVLMAYSYVAQRFGGEFRWTHGAGSLFAKLIWPKAARQRRLLG